MWKREETVRNQPTAIRRGDGVGAVTLSNPEQSSFGATSNQMEREVANIGKSVIVKGELSGSENLTVEGKVEGQIELREHELTIGTNGNIKAEIFAKSVIVMGHVTGNISASDRINIKESGSVEGDISSPTVAIAEGARFRGSIEMQRAQVGQSRNSQSDAKSKTGASSHEKPAVTSTSPPAARTAY